MVRAAMERGAPTPAAPTTAMDGARPRRCNRLAASLCDEWCAGRRDVAVRRFREVQYAIILLRSKLPPALRGNVAQRRPYTRHTIYRRSYRRCLCGGGRRPPLHIRSPLSTLSLVTLTCDLSQLWQPLNFAFSAGIEINLGNMAVDTQAFIGMIPYEKGNHGIIYRQAGITAQVAVTAKYFF